MTGSIVRKHQFGYYELRIYVIIIAEKYFIDVFVKGILLGGENATKNSQQQFKQQSELLEQLPQQQSKFVEQFPQRSKFKFLREQKFVRSESSQPVIFKFIGQIIVFRVWQFTKQWTIPAQFHVIQFGTPP